MANELALEISKTYNKNYKSVMNFINKHSRLSKEEIIQHYKDYANTENLVNYYNRTINNICDKYGFTRNYVIEYLRNNSYAVTLDELEKYFKEAYEHRELLDKFKELGVSRDSYRSILKKHPNASVKDIEKLLSEIEQDKLEKEADIEKFKTICKKEGLNEKTVREYRLKNNIDSYSEAAIRYSNYLNEKRKEQLSFKLKGYNIGYSVYNRYRKLYQDKTFEEIIKLIQSDRDRISFRRYCKDNGYEYNRIKSWLVDRHDEFDGKSFEEIITAYNKRKDKLARCKELNKLADKLGISKSTLSIFVNNYKFTDSSLEEIEIAYRYYRKSKEELGALCKKYRLSYNKAKKIKSDNPHLSNKDIIVMLSDNLCTNINGEIIKVVL